MPATSCSAEFVLVNRRIPYVVGLCRVLPGLAKFSVRNFFSVNKAIHRVLVEGFTKLHDNVVHGHGESRVPDQAQAERMPLFVAVVSFTERDDTVWAERSQRSPLLDPMG
jgi:hypothetical protein